MRFHKIDKYSDLIYMPADQIYESVKSFIMEMRVRNLSTSSMNSRLAGIKYFYDINDIEGIRWRKLNRFKGEETPEHEDRAYTVEEIQSLVSVSDLRLKASVLLLCSAGLRVGSLSTMKVGHLEEKGDCYKISVYKGLKGRGKYSCFCSPEAKRAVAAYISWRERCGEKIGAESPLLRKDFDSEITEAARKNVIPLGYDAIRRDIDKHLIIAGLRVTDHVNKNNRKEVKMTHGFRKWFKSRLVSAKVDPDVRGLLMGHSKKDLDLRYDRLTDDEIFHEYEKAIDALTINPENRLKRKVEKLEVERTEIQALALELEKVKKAIGTT